MTLREQGEAEFFNCCCCLLFGVLLFLIIIEAGINDPARPNGTLATAQS